MKSSDLVVVKAVEMVEMVGSFMRMVVKGKARAV